MVNNIALGNKCFLNLLDKSGHQQKADGYISYDVYEMNNQIGRLPKEFDKLLFPIDEMTCKINEIKI